MAYKTPSTKNKNGFTLVELLIVLAITLILIGTAYFLINPAEQYKKARDEKRLVDITTIERAINEFKMDNGAYPDIANTLRTSTALPQGNAGPIFSTNGGWITGNFSKYFTKLPIDPVNNGVYFYSYMHNGVSYEINAKLEYYAEFAQNDGGNDSNVYEVGDALMII